MLTSSHRHLLHAGTAPYFLISHWFLKEKIEGYQKEYHRTLLHVLSHNWFPFLCVVNKHAVSCYGTSCCCDGWRYLKFWSNEIFFWKQMLLEQNIVIANKISHLFRSNPNPQRKPFLKFELNQFVQKDTPWERK